MTEPSATSTPEQAEQPIEGSVMSFSLEEADAQATATRDRFADTSSADDEVGSVFGNVNYNSLASQMNYEGEWTRNLNGVRIPLMMTTEDMSSRGKYLVFWANPTDVSWNLRQRGVLQETKGGIIQHFFKDGRRRTFFDEPEMQITFQTGNIMPVRMTNPILRTPSGTQPQARQPSTLVTMPHGLLNFYEFIELLDQKKAMSDGNANYVYILYSSLVFPRIVLRGFFAPEAGLTFQEAAQNNAEVTFSTTFRVVSTYPKFNSAQSLANNWGTMQQFYGWDVVSRRSSAFVNVPPDGSQTVSE